MKQTNKLLNISNILNYVFVLTIGFFIVNYFEQYGLLFSTVVVFISGIANFVIGIINIVKRNKKIGILNIIIAVMFIFDAIMFNIIDDVDEWMYFIVLACIVAPIVLTILNLIFNRKNIDINKKIFKTALFFLGILIETVIIIIPIIVNKINLKNINMALKELENDFNTKVIVERYSQETKFYDENGDLIINKQYGLFTPEYIISHNDNSKKLTLLITKYNNKICIVDYEGEIITRLYSIFDDIPISHYLDVLKYQNVPSYSDKYIKKMLTLNEKKGNVYKFGSFEKDGYQITVELNESEIESDIELYNRIFNEESIPTEVEAKFYKFKKRYYMSNKKGEIKTLDCNNLVFTTDKDGNIAISQYYNNNIPYYDKDSAGFFNINGEKTEINKDYIVIDTTDQYAIIRGIKDYNDYIYFFNNKKIIKLNGYSNNLVYYDNKYIMTDSKMYSLKNNEWGLLSNNEHLKDSFFINFDIDTNMKYALPYDHFDFYMYNSRKELIPEDLILNY